MDGVEFNVFRITALAHPGAISYVTKLQAQQFTVPLIGSRPPTNAAEYVADYDINLASANSHLGIYALDERGKVLAFTDYLLTAEEVY